MKIRRQGYTLRFHPATLSMALWIDPNDRYFDTQILRAILRPGDACVDVGANIGHLAIEGALIVGDTGRVTAIEAHPRTAHFLRENVELNGLQNVRVAQVAVGANCGWIGFTDMRDDDLNSVRESTGAGATITVPLVTLDTLLADERPALLKIDVEGFEKFVLMGASGLLERTRCVYFEAWDQHFAKHGYLFSEVHDLLAGHGFEIIQFTDGTRHIVKVERDDAIPVCLNLLAFRDRAELASRTGWTLP